MMTPVSRSKPVTTSSGLAPALAAASLAVVVIGAAEWAAGAWRVEPPPPFWIVGIYPMCAAIYAAAGVLAWLRRPSNPTGRILFACALVLLLAGFVDDPEPLLVATGLTLATVILAAIVHLLHAFPSGRLHGRVSKISVATMYFAATVLQVPLNLFGAASPLRVHTDPSLFSAALWFQRSVGLVAMATTALVLGRRLRDAGPRTRRVLAPFYGYGICVVLFIPLIADVVDQYNVLTVFVAQIAALAVVPIAFTATMALGAFARTGELSELGEALGRADNSIDVLVSTLRRVLGDTSVEICFWSDAVGAFVDTEGRRSQLPDAGDPRRSASRVMIGDRVVGAITYDPIAVPETGLITASGQVVALAIDHGRLTADLLASREDIRESRTRIASAADAERRRIARDLHDGLQTRLVLIGMLAGSAAEALDASHARSLHEHADMALAELRSLVNGLHPAVLTERGLGPAVASLVASVPLSTEVEIDVGDARLSPEVESAAYFVTSEALTNALKHSGTDSLRVRVQRSERSLVLEVADRGSGRGEAAKGSGIQAMEDRVAALGGRLRIESAPGLGTSVWAEVPCVS